MKTVVIAATGRANTASMEAALRRLGVHPELSDDPERLRQAEMAVLPGVGSFGPVAERLRACGILQAFSDRVQAGLGTLAVCLGMQLFCDSSEEAPGVAGMGVVPGVIKSFGSELPVPQFGWNRLSGASAFSPAGGWAYFANSYCLDEVPDGWQAVWSEYGRNFIASLERGRLLLCQYHPELSGEFGKAVLQRWLAAGRLV